MKRIWIAFGGNEGEVIAQLVRARQALATRFDEEAASQLYRTKPVGFLAQPDFINAVVRYRCAAAPEEVLDFLASLEHAAGRVRRQKNGPRPLDLDILLYGVQGEHCQDTPRLTLPHPRMHERAFVLVPLCDLDPELALPRGGLVKTLAASLGETLTVVEDPRWPVP